jgi:CRP/FNR family transcriptional regulator
VASRVDSLSRVELFSSLSKRDLREISSGMKEYSFAPGREIVTEGRGGVGFFVITAGTVAVSSRGRRVRKLGPGEWFGEVGLVADVPRTATVTAETEVTCWGMTAWSFRPIVERNGKLGWKLLQGLAGYLSGR